MPTTSNGKVVLTLEQAKKLQKQIVQADSESDKETLLKHMSSLSAAATPPEDIIRASRIGQALGKLRSHKDSAVADLAKTIVRGWKSAVDKQRISSGNVKGAKKAGGAGSPPATGSASPVTPRLSVAPSPAASTSASASASVSVQQEPIDFEALGDKTRNACLKLIHQALEVDSDASKHRIYATALAVENVTYERVAKREVNADYRNKMRSLSLNLKDKNNPALRKAVVDGDIAPERLVEMTAEEMASDARKAEREALHMSNLFKAKAAEAQEAETDAFECGRCKQRKTRYYQKQTRSADEPMTTFVTCTNCGNKWKFS